MNLRRTLALFTMLLMVLGIATVPQGPTLVCSITGRTTQVNVTWAHSGVVRLDPCCDEVEERSADGAARRALVKAPCCTLHPAATMSHPSAVAPISPDLTMAVAIVSPPTVAPPPHSDQRLAPAPLPTDAPPRGPPSRTPSERAPPPA
jgi:hypothetical protein